MRILAEVTWARDGELEEGEPVYEKGEYWILHYGLDYRIIEVEEGRIAAVNYTVIICQNCKTGQIEKFLPEQCKILGTQIKD
jgi:hypothetical protein